MAGESNLALSIFDYVLDLSLRSLPYQEKPKPKNKKETIRVATIQPVAVSSLFSLENELVLETVQVCFTVVCLTCLIVLVRAVLKRIAAGDND